MSGTEGSAAEPHDAEPDKTQPGFKPAAESNDTFIPSHKRKTNVGFHSPTPAHVKADGDAPTLLRSTAPAPVGLAFLKPPQQPGELGRIANYRVLGHLGSGGMGLVFD